MNKQDAINLFGGVSRLARALGIRPQSVSGWQDGELPQRRVNEIIGAAHRAGMSDVVGKFIVNSAPTERRTERRSAA
jgi:DNA-binding transcriptional regulator YdaS (Cro superfamily)